MRITRKGRKFTGIECRNQERMGVQGEGLRNIFLEGLMNEMSFEDRMGKHTDFRYSIGLDKVLEKKLDTDTS